MSKNKLNPVDFSFEYINKLKSTLDALPLEPLGRFLDILRTARDQGNQVFIFGNGGSAANASHIVNDVSKGTIFEGIPRFRIISLNDNVPLMLAWANDNGYENIFVEQLKNLLNPGDVVIAISGSGNSPNVLKAVEYANSQNAITIGLTGYDGGKLKDLATESLVIPSHSMQHIEDIHLVIGHIFMCYFVEEYRLQTGKDPKPYCT